MKTKKIIILVLIALFDMSLIVSAQYTNLLNFTGTANGRNPNGSLISDGTFLYGMTRYGGTNDLGTIFKIKPDATGYVKLLDFSGAANGNYPDGTFFTDGTFLYGMTYSGGVNNLGTIFKIKPDGTAYAKLLDFTGTANGRDPHGSLISDGTFLYGMTRFGGTNDLGTIFKIKPDGTAYMKLLDFTGVINGDSPWGSLISDGIFLYGMTYSGGTNNFGTIFKIKPDGTAYVKLLDFAGAVNGKYTQGSLISDGIFLYGMTQQGGTNNLGTTFKIKQDGTGYVKLVDFAGVSNGRYPDGDLIFDGTYLYGMTWSGGANTVGTIFKIKPDGTGYAKLFDFAGSVNGSNPYGSLFSDGISLYGMTSAGGNGNGAGNIFKYKESTNFIMNTNISNSQETIIFPNPSNGEFTISTKEKKHEFIITNVLGVTVFSQKNSAEKIKIDLSNQPKGIYFVTINDEINNLSMKIIIQ